MVCDKTMALQECLTRFERAGVGKGYGISEHMHRSTAAAGRAGESTGGLAPRKRILSG
jgi:hypothetical protein